MGPDRCINWVSKLASLGNLWCNNLAVKLISPEGSLLRRLDVALLCILQFGCQRRPLCRTGAAPIGTGLRVISSIQPATAVHRHSFVLITESVHS